MRAILILAAAVLAGCASIEQPSDSLYDAYGRYSKALADGTMLATRQEIFASSMLQKLNVNSEKEAAELTFGSYMHTPQSHYERIEQARGCLTVNGHEEGGDPAIVSLEYRQEAGKWLISSVYVYFPEKPNFLTQALCPDEARQQVMRHLEERPKASSK